MIKKQPFYFLRHGETDWNKQQLCQGQTDIPLNETGRTQALRNREQLKNRGIVSICYSPLLRAKETAELIGAGLENCTLYPIDELKERAWGSLEGRSSELMYAQEQKELNSLEEILEPNDRLFETRAQFLKRVALGINLALEKPSSVLIVSHGRLFHALCQLMNIPIVQQLGHETPIVCTPSSEKWSCLNCI